MNTRRRRSNSERVRINEQTPCGIILRVFLRILAAPMRSYRSAWPDRRRLSRRGVAQGEDEVQRRCILPNEIVIASGLNLVGFDADMGEQLRPYWIDRLLRPHACTERRENGPCQSG